MRTRDPDTLQPHDDAVWTDYDDDERYGDYTVAGASGAAADLRGYEPGLWQREGSSGLTAVPLADQIGTMRQMAIGSGTKRRQVYTAFGEAVHARESVPGLPATATR
ncbi:MAG: hypothetical protein L6Q38_03485, partial [Nitrospira sp.]|nr:hypothetical protein [Nitrospira sp.]